jgi:UDP-glucose 4-epimerase
MKYFVTGGAGFIGSNLCHYLLKAEDGQVTVYDNFSNGRREFLQGFAGDTRLKLIEGDVLNSEFLRQALAEHDFVIHLSANADIAASAKQTDLDLKQTVIATFNVLEAMRLTGVPKIIYSSGSGVYGDVGGLATSETFGPLLPVSMYGATKLSAEGLISAFSQLFGMQAWMFRFANVVGPHQTHGVAYDFIRKLRKDPSRLAILGNGLQSRSYIHVEDVLRAIFHVVERDTSVVSVYNVSAGDYINVRRIAELLVDEMGLPDVQMEFGDAPYGWKGDVPAVGLNDDKIRALGWRPKYGSEQAIRRSIRQMLEYM